MAISKAPTLRVFAERTQHVFDNNQLVTIGRSDHSDLCLTNPWVSRDHGRLRAGEFDWVYEDLGSTHGSFLGVERIEAHVVLGPSDIRLGGARAGVLIRLRPEPICRVFISYRHADGGYGGRLGDDLRRHFPPGYVFVDTDAIAIGDNYRKRINSALHDAEIVIVVIGSTWLTEAEPDGSRRIDNPDDDLRREVESALASRAKVVPVLVGAATMPHEADLPSALSELALRNAYNASLNHWGSDVAQLISRLERLLQPGE